MWIYNYKHWWVYRYCYSAFTKCFRISSSPTASPSMPTAVRQIWQKYSCTFVPTCMNTSAKSFTSVMCFPFSAAAEALIVPLSPCIYTAYAGWSIVHVYAYTLYCILCWLFLNVFEIEGGSFCHHSVKVVYCIVHSSACIDHSTRKKYLKSIFSYV